VGADRRQKRNYRTNNRQKEAKKNICLQEKKEMGQHQLLNKYRLLRKIKPPGPLLLWEQPERKEWGEKKADSKSKEEKKGTRRIYQRPRRVL